MQDYPTGMVNEDVVHEDTSLHDWNIRDWYKYSLTALYGVKIAVMKLEYIR